MCVCTCAAPFCLRGGREQAKSTGSRRASCVLSQLHPAGPVAAAAAAAPSRAAAPEVGGGLHSSCPAKANGVFEMDAASTRACTRLSPATSPPASLSSLGLTCLSSLLSPPPQGSCGWRLSLRGRGWLTRGKLAGKDGSVLPFPAAGAALGHHCLGPRAGLRQGGSPPRRGVLARDPRAISTTGIGGLQADVWGGKSRVEQAPGRRGAAAVAGRSGTAVCRRRRAPPCATSPAPGRALAGRRSLVPPSRPHRRPQTTPDPVPGAASRRGAGPRQAAGRPAERPRRGSG